MLLQNAECFKTQTQKAHEKMNILPENGMIVLYVYLF